MLKGIVYAPQSAGAQALDVPWQGMCNTQLATHASEAALLVGIAFVIS